MPFSRVLLLSLLCAGAAGQAVLTASDLDSSASALAAATESYTVGSDPAFWSNSVSFPADMQTVVVGTKLIFHYSDYHDVTVAASAKLEHLFAVATASRPKGQDKSWSAWRRAQPPERARHRARRLREPREEHAPVVGWQNI